MIHIKKGVRLTRGMAMTVIMVNANEIFTLYDLPCVITSGIEGKHTKGSLHYLFCALDFRGNTLEEETRVLIMGKLQDALGEDFGVISSNAGAIHIQFKPKGAIN